MQLKTICLIGLLMVAASAGCAGGPISDTGYRGTWSRENEGAVSTVSLWTEGERAWFRWSLRSDDGSRLVRCEWNGECGEFRGNEKWATFRFRAWVDPNSRRMRVHVKEELLSEPGSSREWTDELVVETGGRSMVAITLEANGSSFDEGERPLFRFEKVSDDVAEPPSTDGPGTGGGRG